MLNFDTLMSLRSKGLSLSAITVHAYITEHGRPPVGFIAKACKLSERAVYLALRQLQILSGSLDHEIVLEEGTPQALAPAPQALAKTVDNSDPLVAAALHIANAYPQLTHNLIRNFGRQVVETALAHVRNLKKCGYKVTKGLYAVFIHACKHPAKYGTPERHQDATDAKREQKKREAGRAVAEASTVATEERSRANLEAQHKALQLAEMVKGGHDKRARMLAPRWGVRWSDVERVLPLVGGS